jgi:hypothetical protein
MDAFIEWLRATSLSVTFQNEVAWLWPLCESLHFLGLSFLIGGAGLFDLRLLGFMKSIPRPVGDRRVHAQPGDGTGFPDLATAAVPDQSVDVVQGPFPDRGRRQRDGL